MSKATVALRELFFLPGVKEQVIPGIDRYVDHVVFYNTARPPYLEQVTIREVYRLLMDYWKVVPDKIQKETIVPMLENELSGFSDKEKDGYAYFGNPESIYRIASAKNETPVMRPNPEYWDRKLPRTAIQFLWCEIPDKEVVKQKLEKTLKNNDGYYYVWRLNDELDVTKLLPAIEK